MTDKTRPAGFLNRWSARKQQAVHDHSIDEPATKAKNVADETPTLETADGSDLHSEAAPAPKTAQESGVHNTTTLLPADNAGVSPDIAVVDSPEPDEEPLLSDADMPPVESLTSDSNLSCFFNKGVSATLKKAALRHVFMLPKYNVRDGLNDYDGDYTSFEPLGDTITSDMKWHTARKERARLEAEAKELEALKEQRAQQLAEEKEATEQEVTEQDVAEQDVAEQDVAEQDVAEQDVAELDLEGKDGEAANTASTAPASDELVTQEQLLEGETPSSAAQSTDSTAGAAKINPSIAGQHSAKVKEDAPFAERIALVATDSRQAAQDMASARVQRAGRGKLTRIEKNTTQRKDQLPQLNDDEHLNTRDIQESSE